MIGYIQGKKILTKENYAVILVNNIGYNVYLTNELLVKNNDEDISLYIKTIVKENDISLYGFETEQQLNLFETLLTVNGIGPKVSLNIISSIEPQLLIDAIINKNISIITSIKGIGKKGAEKIIFDLKDKFEKDKKNMISSNIESKYNDLIQSLIFLGYSSKLSEDIVKKIYDQNKDLDELIKLAIKSIN